jgi:hypothetical protein
MNFHRIGKSFFVAVVLGLAALIPAIAQAPSSSSTVPIPRTPDGKPDLSGIWQVLNQAAVDIQDHDAQKGVPAGIGVVEGGDIPYTPTALAKKKDNYEKRATLDPEARCYLPGVPRLMYMPFPFQIFQSPTQVTMLFEYVHATRLVFMNTPHPPDGLDFWMGDARGKWEGDTLVVDTNNFNDKTWFDRAGNFHSDALHLVERYTLADPDHINYEVTVTDPKVFTRPWKMNMILYRRKEAGLRVLEYECYTFDRQFHVTPGMTPPTQ